MKITTKTTCLLLVITFITACSTQHSLNCDGKDGEFQKIIASGDLGKITEFVALEEGFDIDACCINHRPPLQHFVDEGNQKMVKFFLNQGANINKKDMMGTTALMIAAESGQKEMVQLLLEKGADPDLVNNYGKTARSMAQKRRHQDIAKLFEEAIPLAEVVVEATGQPPKTLKVLLQEEGLNPTEVQEWIRMSGKDLLFKAAQQGWSAVVGRLLDDGENSNIKNNAGWPVLMIAAQKGHTEVIKVLESN